MEGPQTADTRTTIRQSYTIPDTSMYTTPTITAFTTARNWNWPRCPPTGEWIGKPCFTYVVKFYAAIKKTEMMAFAIQCIQQSLG